MINKNIIVLASLCLVTVDAFADQKPIFEGFEKLQAVVQGLDQVGEDCQDVNYISKASVSLGLRTYVINCKTVDVQVKLNQARTRLSQIRITEKE